MRLLEPFALRHLVSLTRRAGLERLDTLRIRPHLKTLGFSTSTAPRGKAPKARDVIFHVFPFLPTSSTFTTLFRLLLLEPHPIAVSCRLRPTTLTPSEEAFLEEQIAHCE